MDLTVTPSDVPEIIFRGKKTLSRQDLQTLQTTGQLLCPSCKGATHFLRVERDHAKDEIYCPSEHLSWGLMATV